MAYNFPNNPAYNEVFGVYRWDNEKWILNVGGTPKPPSTPPELLTGLIAWYDASIPGSFTLSGSNITAVADQSGGGNHMTTLGSSSTSPPVYSATGFNGSYPSMNFTRYSAGGGGTFNSYCPIAKTSFPMGTGNTLTMWVVGQYSSASDAFCRFVSYSATGNDGNNASSFWTGRTNVESVTGLNRSNTSTTAQSVTYNIPFTEIITVDSSGLVSHYINGVLKTSSTIAGNWTSAGTIGLGGSVSSYAATLEGKIAEVGVATGYADATAVGRLQTYLANKWNVSAAATFLARTTGLDTAHRNAYTALINGLVEDGVWSTLAGLWIFATQDAATAVLNLVSTSFTATPNGNPVFTANRGYTGIDGSAAVYINTGFNPQANQPASVFGMNSAHISYWQLTSVSSDMGMGVVDSGHTTYLAGAHTDGNFYGRLNSANSGGGVANTNKTGQFLLSRSSSVLTEGYRNGSLLLTSAAASTGTYQNGPIFTLAFNNGGNALGAGGQFAMASLGGALTAAQALAFYTRLNTYMTAIVTAEPSASAAFLARTTGLDGTHIAAYTALIDGLVTDNIWPKLDAIWILATQDATTAKLNLKSASYTMTAVGSPTFTADRGYTGVEGSTTVYLDTNFNGSTANGGFNRVFSHISAWSITDFNASGGSALIGSNNGSSSQTVIYPRISGQAYLRITGFTTGVQVASGNSSGHWIANRTAGNAISGYRNGSSIGTGGDTNSALLNQNMYVLASNENGTPGGGTGRQVAMASIGAGLSAAESLLYYNRLRTFMTAVGVP